MNLTDNEYRNGEPAASLRSDIDRIAPSSSKIAPFAAVLVAVLPLLVPHSSAEIRTYLALRALFGNRPGFRATYRKIADYMQGGDDPDTIRKACGVLEAAELVRKHGKRGDRDGFGFSFAGFEYPIPRNTKVLPLAPRGPREPEGTQVGLPFKGGGPAGAYADHHSATGKQAREHGPPPHRIDRSDLHRIDRSHVDRIDRSGVSVLDPELDRRNKPPPQDLTGKSAERAAEAAAEFRSRIPELGRKWAELGRYPEEKWESAFAELRTLARARGLPIPGARSCSDYLKEAADDPGVRRFDPKKGNPLALALLAFRFLPWWEERIRIHKARLAKRARDEHGG